MITTKNRIKIILIVAVLILLVGFFSPKIEPTLKNITGKVIPDFIFPMPIPPDDPNAQTYCEAMFNGYWWGDSCHRNEPVCGDFSINTVDEFCDDGNLANGDGCSSNCIIETGWTCSGSPSVCFVCTDEDNDNYYVEAVGCNVQPGFLGHLDCDDTNPDIYPGAIEVCNGVDDNCGGEVDEVCACVVGETQICGIEEGECQKGIMTCLETGWGLCEDSIAPVNEICDDNKDNDCDSVIDCADDDCVNQVCGTNKICKDTVCTSICGNQQLDLGEECDGGDNCKSDCTCETGYTSTINGCTLLETQAVQIGDCTTIRKRVLDTNEDGVNEYCGEDLKLYSIKPIDSDCEVDSECIDNICGSNKKCLSYDSLLEAVCLLEPTVDWNDNHLLFYNTFC